MKKTNKRIHIHLHFSKAQFVLLSIFILSVVFAAGGYAYYKLYYVNNHDTSLNGSEAKEVKQNYIPPDVQKEIRSGKIHFPTPGPQGPVPISETIRVPILMYHYVEYVADKGDKTRISLDITPYTFEEEVKTLKDAGYNFMTNSELNDVLDGKKQLPSKPILLTFDDGYRDFYTDAYPILKKYNVKATAYLISGFLNRPNHLLDSQVVEIIQSGLVEIGAHTIHHRWLKGLTLKDASTEIFQSRVQLEQKFNISVTSFAYPFGAFDDQTIHIAQTAGYRSAVSTIPGVEQNQINRYFLFRLRPGGRIGKTLLDFLNQSKY